MLGHYLIVALRNFRRAPVATGINVLALALGLTCFIVAYAVVQYWGHAEQGFAKADRTYAITHDVTLKDGSVSTGERVDGLPLYAKYLRLDFPEFETIARADSVGETPVVAGDKKMVLPTAYADPDFLDIFDLPFLAGDPKSALVQPGSAVLTDVAAKRLFGTTNVIGRSLRLDGIADVTVTGAIGEIPQPSHIGRTRSSLLRFDILASWDVKERLDKARTPPPDPKSPPPPENWAGGFCCLTYVVLSKGSAETPQSLAPRFAAMLKHRVPAGLQASFDFKLGMIPIRRLMTAQLDSTVFAGEDIGISITSLLILFGGLVLLVACVNYANLATAQALRRAGEVGLRKVLGASRRQIVMQYLLEAGLLAGAALIVALVVATVATPVIRTATNIDLGLVLFAGPAFWVFLTGMIALVTVAAGAYPALYLSRVRPIRALNPGGVRGVARLIPKLLVAVQFAAASFLLITLIVMQQQGHELRRNGLGTGSDRLVVITDDWATTKVRTTTLIDRLRRLPQVEDASTVTERLWGNRVGYLTFRRSPDASSAQYSAVTTGADYAFFSTMNIRILAGRVFDRAHGGDRPNGDSRDASPNAPLNIVIDRVLSDELGFAKPEDAVGQTLFIPLKAYGRADTRARIIGVVESKPLHFAGAGAKGSVYMMAIGWPQVVVRIAGNDIPGALKAIKREWNKLAPDNAFQYQFADQLFAQGYAVFGHVGEAFSGLALFAGLISMIGLIGMGTHVAVRRRHEIGVRKTLGASTRQIAVMLLKDFSKPVVAANIIAWPVAYLAANAYLNVFIHRIALSAAPFAASLAITVLIAWAAVGTQAFRAARVKPAAVLRYE